MSNLIHNERIKLTATFANNLAVGAFLGAIFIPIASKISTNEIDLVHGLIYVWGCLALFDRIVIARSLDVARPEGIARDS